MIVTSNTLLLLLVVPLVFAFRQQSVGVRGRLMCGSQPSSNTKVKLWNKNKIGTDDQLADTMTDNYGNFVIFGGVGSIFSMNVHLKIYHDCARRLPCQRKIDLGIPEKYISRSQNVENYFEAGTLNLEFIFPQEESSCIN
ncbi:Transthyretin-like family protein [Aphelenchoides besseyi]|nr:Transthyretin-like family protein [Aphelenchoides besseyi]